MKRERLEQLRRVVLAAPADRFHMRTWCEKSPCGTAYCAAGWAAIDPWFQDNTEIGEVLDVNYDGMIFTHCFNVTYKLSRIFDISSDDSDRLFGAWLSPDYSDPHGVTREDVVENIDRILAGKPAISYHCGSI
jgi:hypothetical protein